MKKYIFIFILLSSNFVYSQTIYDQATTKNKGSTTVVMYGFGSLPKIYSSPQEALQVHIANTCVNTTGPLFKELVDSGIDMHNEIHVDKLWCRYNRWEESQGVRYNEFGPYVSQSGLNASVTTSEACGFEDGGEPNSHTFEINDLCYDPDELSQLDTCEIGQKIPKVNSVQTSACAVLPNGSICSVVDNGDGAFTVEYENSCYQPNQTDFYSVTETITPLETECLNADGQYVYCNETNQPEGNHTPDKYCGTYDLGQGEVYVCYDKDEDSDDIPNYKDEDYQDSTPPDGDGENPPDGDGENPPDGDGSPPQDFTDITNGISETNNALNQTNQTLNSMKDILKDGQFATTFLQRGSGKVESLFNQESLDALDLQIEDKKDELTNTINTIKSEAASYFQFNEVNANFESRMITIGGNSYNISFDRFASSYPLIATIIMFIAVLSSAVIILGGNK